MKSLLYLPLLGLMAVLLLAATWTETQSTTRPVPTDAGLLSPGSTLGEGAALGGATGWRMWICATDPADGGGAAIESGYVDVWVYNPHTALWMQNTTLRQQLSPPTGGARCLQFTDIEQVMKRAGYRVVGAAREVTIDGGAGTVQVGIDVCRPWDC